MLFNTRFFFSADMSKTHLRLLSLILFAFTLLVYPGCGVKHLHAQAASLAPVGVQQFSDNDGNPLAGGLLYTYVAGTSSPQATYTSSTGMGLNTNPIVLDSGGRAAIWLANAAAYKFILQNSLGVTIWTADNVTAGPLDMMTLDTNQTVTANKTFNGTMTFNNVIINGACVGCTSAGSVNFADIGSGVNSTASMSLASGAILSAAGGTVTFASGSHTTPWLVGLTAAIPATCGVGEAYFASDATAGEEVYLCTAMNMWTQVAGGGGSTAFSALTNGTNTTAAMVVGSGAHLATGGTGVINFATGGHTTPVLVGAAAAVPATCGVGEMYFASDATAGQNFYYCTASNTWTQQVAGSGGTAFNAITGGTNSAGVTMKVGSTSVLQPTGTGLIQASQLVDSFGNLSFSGGTGVSGAVNYVVVRDNTTGSGPTLAANGSDTNINLSVLSKGTGNLYLNSSVAYADTLGNLTVTSCTGCGGGASLPVSDATSIVKGNSDSTKQMRIDVSTLVSTGTTRVATMPDTNLILAGSNINQTFSGVNTFSNNNTFNGTETFTGTLDANTTNLSGTTTVSGSFVSTGGMTVSGTTPSFNNGVNVSGTATASSFTGNNVVASSLLEVTGGSFAVASGVTTTFDDIPVFVDGFTITGGTGTVNSSGTLSLNGLTAFQPAAVTIFGTTTSPADTCNVFNVGHIHAVSNATSTAFGATYSGGGSSFAMVVCNGSNYVVF